MPPEATQILLALAAGILAGFFGGVLATLLYHQWMDKGSSTRRGGRGRDSTG